MAKSNNFTKKDKVCSVRFDHIVLSIMDKWIKLGLLKGEETNRSKIIRKLVLDKDKEGGLYDPLDQQMLLANKILDKMSSLTAREIEKIFVKAERYTTELKNNNYSFDNPDTIQQIRTTLAQLKEINATKQFNDLLAALQKYHNTNSNYTIEESLTKRKKEQKKKEELQEKNDKIKDKQYAERTKAKEPVTIKLPKRSREEELVSLRRSYEEMPLTDLKKGTTESTFENLLKDEQKLVLDILETRLDILEKREIAEIADYKASQIKTPAEGKA